MVFRSLLLVAGLAVVAYLVAQVGVAAIADAFRRLSWRLAVVLLFPTCVAVVLDTLAWRYAFLEPPRRFLRLLGARIAGEAVNLVTPTASVGGEPLKAHLLRPGIPMREGLASVIADKTTAVASQVLVLLAGLALGLFLMPPASPLMLAMGALLVLEMLCVGGFVAVQLRGLAGGGGRLLTRFRMGPSRERQAVLDGVDDALRVLYGRHGRRLCASVALHFLGFAAGTLEVYLVVRSLGLPVTLAGAFVVGAFGTAVKFLSFMVPASLGALEGGNVAIFAAFGLGGTAGLTYTLVRRLRELLWAGLGFLALSAVSARPAPPASGP